MHSPQCYPLSLPYSFCPTHLTLISRRTASNFFFFLLFRTHRVSCLCKSRFGELALDFLECSYSISCGSWSSKAQLFVHKSTNWFHEAWSCRSADEISSVSPKLGENSQHSRVCTWIYKKVARQFSVTRSWVALYQVIAVSGTLSARFTVGRRYAY